MNGTFLDALATEAKTLITHIALLDSSNAEVATARLPVTWTGPNAGDGLIRPDGDLVFDMQAGDEVTQWRGYSALTGGVDYGGATLTTVTFSNDGTYTLEAANTAIDLNAA